MLITRVYVSLNASPMEWLREVDLVQNMARHLVFRIARVPASGGLPPKYPLPTGEPISVIYLDDCNFVGNFVAGDISESNEHKRCVAQDSAHCCHAGPECCCHAVAGR